METQVIASEHNKRVIILPPLHTPYLLPDEAALYLRLEARTLDLHRKNKTGPSYRKHGGKVCYHQDDLDKWSLVHETVS